MLSPLVAPRFIVMNKQPSISTHLIRATPAHRLWNKLPIPGAFGKTNRAAGYSAANLTPMRNAKLLSIKPAPIDNRPPVWDGTNGNYQPTAHVKTVDWRNGVPIWDDSISDYRTKDFRDWMLKRLPELYIRDSDDTELVTLYNETVEDINATNARIEELLGNKETTSVATTDR